MSDRPQMLDSTEHAAIPFYRDVRTLRWILQFAVLGAVILLIVVLYTNLRANLEEVGLNLSFDFLTRRAGFRISEGPFFDADDPVYRAYLVGLANTVRAVVLGIILTTILGLIVGIARLSQNWLVRKIAQIYVEVMQNIPLLVQLFFYLALVQALPRPRRGEMLTIPADNPIAYFSRRSSAVPGLERLESFNTWLIFLAIGVVIGVVLYRIRVVMQEREGRPPIGQFWWGTGGFAAIAIIGWFIVPGNPVGISVPDLVGEGVIVNLEGGWELTANYMALVLGLTLYSGAYTAEVVRSGIQSVPNGQIEAATSIGLTRGQRLRLVILPQAMRVITPPLINQYLNLTKNSSLAIAVAYPDVFNVTTTIGNQTGQNIQIIVIVMLTYLSFSLFISLVLNIYNRQTKLVER